MLDTEKQNNYKIIKSNKYKGITISIKRDQRIVVSAPKNVSTQKIEEFVCKNKKWIEDNIDKLENNPSTRKHTFTDGDLFLLDGKLYKLKLINVKDSSFKNINKIVSNIILNDEKKEIQLYINNNSKDQIELAIVQYYKSRTRDIILRKFEENIAFKDFKPLIQNIKIQKSNTRWGSCSAKDNINFSFRLAMLPSSCIDYVIFHELVHILEKNHSKNFYSKLEKVCPNYRELEHQIKNIERRFNVSLA